MKWPALLMIAFACAACGIVAVKYISRPQPAEIAAPSKKIADVPTVTISPPTVTVYQPAAKKRLNLPKAARSDAAQHVTAATRVEPTDRAVDVTSVINSDTGLTTLYTREVERPWIESVNKTRFGVFVGHTSVEPAIRLTARHQFARVWGVELAGVAHVDLMRSGAAGFVGVGGEF